MENNNEILIPYVGMPATYCIGSDRYAGEIVSVYRGGHLIGFRDRGKGGQVEMFSFRKNGRYYKTGHEIGKSGSLRLGVAEDYRDPSF